MSSSCCDQDPKFDGASPGFRRALWAVIAINAAMFFIEISAGIMADSKALQADALDFFGDTTTYAISLYVIGHSLRWRARAALFKGFTLGGLGLWVLGSTVYQVFVLKVPEAAVMGIVGFMALAANVISVLLLLKYRDGDANVRSVWLCSRNDAIGNVAVIIAASGIWATATAWPDLIVAGIMASLFLRGAFQIVKQAMDELRHADSHVAAE
jgi:cation diffusion facilitator family transporter